MKYFLIEKDREFYSSPQFKSWHQDINFLQEKDYYKLPRRKTFFINENNFLLWTDIISSPVFIVSEKVKEVIKLYDKKVKIKQMILIEQKNADMQVYYLPLLECMECLSEERDKGLNPDITKRLILDRDKIKDKLIFKVKDAGKRYVIGRLDFVESILKREAIGIKLTELKVI